MHGVTGALVQRCIGHDIKRNILLNRAGKKHQYKIIMGKAAIFYLIFFDNHVITG